MAEKEMYDYLSVATADYGTALDMTSVRPQDVIDEEGEMNQIPLMGDDGSVEVNSLADGPICFYCTVKFNHKSASDIGIVYDFFFDSTKANGFENTFKWVHPEDGHTYVARFWSKLKRLRGRPNHQALPSIMLRVEGKIVDV